MRGGRMEDLGGGEDHTGFRKVAFVNLHIAIKIESHFGIHLVNQLYKIVQQIHCVNNTRRILEVQAVGVSSWVYLVCVESRRY
jgi:hypothetical protein